jgi:predicted nucleic acid-binding protein
MTTKTKYLDTNYFLRLVLIDNLEQYLVVRNLLEDSQKLNFGLYTSVLVICECEWVLKSFYKFQKKDRINIFTKILSLEAVEFQDHEILNIAVQNMQNNNLGLEDNYHIAFCITNNIEFSTFDQKAMNECTRLKS